MMIQVLFEHSCIGRECNKVGTLHVKYVEVDEVSSSYILPDVRCVNTNNQLRVTMLNGRRV